MAEGIVFTSSGVPISQSADYQHVLDTRYPTMDIAFEQDIDITFSGWQTGWNIIQLLQHNFNYLPAFEFFQDRSIDEGNTDVLSFLHISDYVKGTANSIICRLLWVGGDSTATSRIKGFLRVYSVNITATYQAPTESLGVGQPSNSAFGIKFKDPQSGLTTLDSRLKALGIHMHDTVTASAAGTITISHDVGYPPSWEFCKINPPSGIYPRDTDIDPFNINPGRVNADPYQLTFSGGQGALSGNYAYLLYKDPAEVAL